MSVEMMVQRFETIQRDAEQRQERAGNLKSAMDEGVRALSAAIEAFRGAGLVAEELQTLCRLVDERGTHTQSESTGAPTRPPAADGARATV